MSSNKMSNNRMAALRKSGNIQPLNCGGIWYLSRRVSVAYAELDRRGIAFVSKEISVRDDPRGSRVGPVVKQLNAELEGYWKGMRDGQSADARLRYEAAQNRARALGLPYQTAQEISEQPIDDIMRRGLRGLALAGSASSTTLICV